MMGDNIVVCLNIQFALLFLAKASHRHLNYVVISRIIDISLVCRLG